MTLKMCQKVDELRQKYLDGKGDQTTSGGYKWWLGLRQPDLPWGSSRWVRGVGFAITLLILLVVRGKFLSCLDDAKENCHHGDGTFLKKSLFLLLRAGQGLDSAPGRLGRGGVLHRGAAVGGNFVVRSLLVTAAAAVR